LPAAGGVLGLALLGAVRISDRERTGGVGAGATGLDDVREFVDEQLAALAGRRCESAGPEHDVVADRVGVRGHVGCRLGGGAVGVDDDVARIDAEIPAERLTGRVGERAAGLAQGAVNALRHRRPRSWVRRWVAGPA